jgi:hypothetical protein
MGWSTFRKTGLTHHRASASVKGYTLITPNGSDATYLLDMAGRIVHRWRYDGFRAFYARLLANGNLLSMATHNSVTRPVLAPGANPTFEQAVRLHGGNATHLLELNWDSEVVWQYENPCIHHDFVRLPNGNTLMPFTVELEPGFARSVRGGSVSRGARPIMVADEIIEVDTAGREVRRLPVWQMLDPARDPICPLENRQEWTHLNGIDVNSAGEVVFSCRENSRVGIIDRDGKLAWKYGDPNTNHQHCPTFLANGNVQIFDNGHHARGQSRSRIIEVSPKDGSVAWSYEADPPPSFYSSHISGAQRLAGGNVLVCEGSAGRVFEVTNRCEVVWEWISPIINPQGRGPAVFRAHRYEQTDPALAGRDLDWRRHRPLNEMHGLGA